MLPPFTSTTATFAVLDSEQNISSEPRKIGGGDHESLFWMSLRDVTTPAEKTHIVDVSEFCNPFVLQNNWSICGFRLVGWQVCPLVLYFDFLPNHV